MRDRCVTIGCWPLRRVPGPARDSMPQKRFYQQLYFWVLVGMLLGIGVGYLTPEAAPRQFALFGKHFAFSGTQLKPLSDAFIRLIRMMIAPIIFTTVVTGIAGMGNLKRLGRIGVKAFIYFEVMTTVALIIGWTVAAVFRPGAGMNVDVSSLSTADIKATLLQAQSHHSMVDFLLNIIPETIVGAFAKGEILQVLLFSVMFGIAMVGIGEANQQVILA